MTNYSSLDYNDKNRWASYWWQAKAIFDLRRRNIMVIGKGNGIVPIYLQMLGLNVKTLDNDATLNPDIAASVLDMPIGDNSFDIVLCAEVLEHLPFDDFYRALSEIKRITKFGAVISLPHFGPAVRIFFKIPFLPELKLNIKLPYPIKHQFKGEHYWEIGKKNYPLKLIKSEIIKSGFSIKKDYIIFENPSHHFFILKK